MYICMKYTIVFWMLHEGGCLQTVFDVVFCCPSGVSCFTATRTGIYNAEIAIVIAM